jgi:dTDP-glucose 4,6-dehydratase
LYEGVAGEVYNVGTGVETSGNEVARTVVEVMGKPAELIQYVADRPGHDYRYAVDIGKISALGWRPRVDFRSGMQHTIGWYVDNESWWRPLKSTEYWTYYRRNYRAITRS